MPRMSLVVASWRVPLVLLLALLVLKTETQHLGDVHDPPLHNLHHAHFHRANFTHARHGHNGTHFVNGTRLHASFLHHLNLTYGDANSSATEIVLSPLDNSSMSVPSSLLSTLQRAAGVYNDPKKVAKYNLHKTVLMTGCNYGFLNHLHNFKCFADRLDMKFIVIAMDAKAHEYIINNTTMISYLMDGGVVGGVTGAPTDFRSPQFNLITTKKKEAVHDVLKLGYDVLFTDTDVAMIRDPLPRMLWENVDYVHSLNAVCTKEDTWDFRRSKEEGNTGFYYVRSSEKTAKLWQAAYEAAPRFKHLDDQAVFWNVIRHSSDPSVIPLGHCRHYNASTNPKYNASLEPSPSKIPEIVTCFLDTCAFSSGMLSRIWVPEYTYEELLANLQYRNETIHTLHANYIKGNHNKLLKMKEHGFWIAAPDNDGLNNICLKFNDTSTNSTSP